MRAYSRVSPQCVSYDGASLFLTHNDENFLPRGEEVVFVTWTVNKTWKLYVNINRSSYIIFFKTELINTPQKNNRQVEI